MGYPPGSARGTHIEEIPSAIHCTHTSGLTRRGKAPPVNEFSGEDPGLFLEDWLPAG